MLYLLERILALAPRETLTGLVLEKCSCVELNLQCFWSFKLESPWLPQLHATSIQARFGTVAPTTPVTLHATQMRLSALAVEPVASASATCTVTMRILRPPMYQGPVQISHFLTQLVLALPVSDLPA